MNKLFLYTSVFVLIVITPKVFAQTASKSDFNPFPQMEQDQQKADDDTAASSGQNEDNWPPMNDQAQMNSEGAHD